MEFLNQVGRILIGAMDSAVEYNRKKAQNNRLKKIIQKEKRQISRQYLALGKYYYENLQGAVSDQHTEKACRYIEFSQERMRKARKRLVELHSRDYEKAQQRDTDAEELSGSPMEGEQESGQTGQDSPQRGQPEEENAREE